MESIKSRNDDGSQNVDYYKQYYEKNKEIIRQKNKQRYLARRATKEGIEKHRDKCTEHSRAYRERHPEKIKERRKRLHLSRKRRALEKVGDLICANCGCDEVDFLEFNHKNGNGCKEFKENGSSMIDKILTHGRTTDDLNILCRVCNALEYLERRNNDSSKRFTVLWE